MEAAGQAELLLDPWGQAGVPSPSTTPLSARGSHAAPRAAWAGSSVLSLAAAVSPITANYTDPAGWASPSLAVYSQLALQEGPGVSLSSESSSHTSWAPVIDEAQKLVPEFPDNRAPATLGYGGPN